MLRDMGFSICSTSFSACNVICNVRFGFPLGLRRAKLDVRDIELLRFDFHKRINLPEHQALNDTRANCFAFGGR